MRYIITESQYSSLLEQTSYEKGIMDRSTSMLNKMSNLDPHTVADFLSIVTPIIPVVGPAISAGILLGDAALYYNEGDKKTATMVALFPFLPFGKIGKLIPNVERLGKEGMENLAKKIGKEGGKGLTQIEKEVADAMAKNKEVLNQEMKRISDDLAAKTPKTAAKKVSSSFLKRFMVGDCVSHVNCPAMKAIISDLYSKLVNTSRFGKFYPKDIKLLSREVIGPNSKYPREAIEIQLKDGNKILMYKSSGANVKTTGKKAGEWFVLPGFAQNGWFIKTDETINLTKGGSKYLTDLAKFLEYNGAGMLGR